MLKFVNNGKKVMEMTDNGDVTVYDAKLTGAGQLKEDVEEGDKKDGEQE